MNRLEERGSKEVERADETETIGPLAFFVLLYVGHNFVASVVRENAVDTANDRCLICGSKRTSLKIDSRENDVNRSSNVSLLRGIKMIGMMQRRR